MIEPSSVSDVDDDDGFRERMERLARRFNDQQAEAYPDPPRQTKQLSGKDRWKSGKTMDQKASSDFYCSPKIVTEPLAEFFGGPVAVDPCSNDRSMVLAHQAYTFGGLHRPWGRTSYENPPYSKSGIWTNKAIFELDSGRVEELVRLTMVATSTAWWAKQCLTPKRNPRLLFTKRLFFIDPFSETPQQTKTNARFDTVITYYGPRVRAFEKAFAHVTRWMQWGR